jgi:hypothetical protein
MRSSILPAVSRDCAPEPRRPRCSQRVEPPEDLIPGATRERAYAQNPIVTIGGSADRFNPFGPAFNFPPFISRVRRSFEHIGSLFAELNLSSLIAWLQ